MGEFFWHFSIGLVVSFLGSIPLGTVNLAVVQTTINSNFRAGFYFALGATIIELIYSAIAIKFIAVLLNNAHVELSIQIISIPAFLVLGIFYYRKQNSSREVEIRNKKSFYNGLLIGLVNPLQIPFWIAYGSYLLSNEWIRNEDSLLNMFIAGISVGTLLVLTLIALVSKKIIGRLDLQTNTVNKGIGVILFLLTAYQAVRVAQYFL